MILDASQFVHHGVDWANKTLSETGFSTLETRSLGMFGEF